MTNDELSFGLRDLDGAVEVMVLLNGKRYPIKNITLPYKEYVVLLSCSEEPDNEKR